MTTHNLPQSQVWMVLNQYSHEKINATQWDLEIPVNMKVFQDKELVWIGYLLLKVHNIRPQHKGQVEWIGNNND